MSKNKQTNKQTNKNNRFSRQNNSFARVAHFFLYIPLPFSYDYDVKLPNFNFYGRRKQATTKFYFSFLTSGGFAYV